jgi:trigger factor
VTIKEIKRKDLPELNDEFAQQFGEFETMEQLRTKMTELRQKHEQDRIENDLKENIIQALIQKNPLEVPQALVKRQLDYMLDNLKNRLKSQRMSMEAMGMNDDAFRQRFQEAAADKVRGSLLLRALVEQEKFSATEEDLVQRYEQIASGNTDVLERVKEYYAGNSSARQSLEAEIKEDKAIRFLQDNAAITEVEPAHQQA